MNFLIKIIIPILGFFTTGIASVLLDRHYIGIDKELEFLELSKRRYQAITPKLKYEFKQKIREQISLV